MNTLWPATKGFFKIEKKDAWVRKNIDWLIQRHGADNVVSLDIHHDETTSHTQAIVIPEKDGKLNAKYFTGGVKIMRELQTEYAKKRQNSDLNEGQKKEKKRREQERGGGQGMGL